MQRLRSSTPKKAILCLLSLPNARMCVCVCVVVVRAVPDGQADERDVGTRGGWQTEGASYKSASPFT
eukprot:6178556-Pleurochrysis_carterae.AAC.3